MSTPATSKPVVHSVTTKQFVTGRWVSYCTCGEESKRVTHKPIVVAWRRSHYLKVRNTA